jgi:hypothetical protein
MLFNEKAQKFHIGNICEQSFKEIRVATGIGSDELPGQPGIQRAEDVRAASACSIRLTKCSMGW